MISSESLHPRLVVISAVLVLGQAAFGDVQLPAIFSDHAVLQRAKSVPVWGKADPGEAVAVHLGKAGAATTANSQGQWKVLLDLAGEGQGPYALKIQGKNQIVISDVLIGQVWICSGQSNMEFTMPATTGGKEEIAASANPMLRQFLVKKAASLKPLDNCAGTWTSAGPATTGTFTAVGYYFGKKLQKELMAPVGLINTSFGGTPSEAWTSAEAIDSVPALKERKDQLVSYATGFPAGIAAWQTQYREWAAKYHREDHPAADPMSFAGPGVSSDGWKKIKLPGTFAENGLPDAGAIWLRRKVKIPSVPAKELRGGYQLTPGLIHGFDTVYWNGKKVGETNEKLPGASEPRKYGVPLSILDLGSDTMLAIRVFCPQGGAGVEGDKVLFNADGAPLEGEWEAKVEFELPALAPAAREAFPKPLERPMETRLTATGLYNAMIQPVVPYALSGVIWYQGETNAVRAFQYRTAFPLLIRDWRSKWGGELPFYFCQLANHGKPLTIPTESSWAELREAQAMALGEPRTGMAVLIDIGEAGDIHPRNKREAGERLARIALAKNYGKSIPFSGPTYRAMEVEGNKARIRFSNAEGGLTAKTLPREYLPRSIDPNTKLPVVLNSPNSAVQGFAVCGEDRRWKWADASIEGESVVVSSSEVSKPIAVRYGWADNPTCNLYNKAGLPAAPFRTDDFPAITLHGQY